MINSETNSNRLCEESPEAKVSLGLRGGIPYLLIYLFQNFLQLRTVLLFPVLNWFLIIVEKGRYVRTLGIVYVAKSL
ncbi:MAG: hypothetical protein WCP72_07575 [Desulfomonile sp.]